MSATADPFAQWRFHNPVSIHFGTGVRASLGDLTAHKRALIVTTARGRQQIEEDAVLAPIIATIAPEWVDSVRPNPSLADTQAEIDRLVGGDIDLIVAFGGGSAMDTAKAMAAALAPRAACRDLATIIADPQRYLNEPVLPIVAISTTSGTGAEVTPFATIWNTSARKKLSLASPYLFPQTAIIDPELTFSLPHKSTISTGLDALNQAFESVWNRNRTPITTGLAARSIGLALDALRVLSGDLGDKGARVQMAEASVLAGVCISQTRTAICHSVSYPLTAHFGIDHGLACAFTMAPVARRVLENQPKGLAEVAMAMGLPGPEALVDKLESVLEACDLRKLVEPDLPEIGAIIALRDEMFTPGRSDNFVLPVSPDDIEEILKSSLQFSKA